ncbi:hypothetical protein [Streptomyces sp. H34-S4]|uniref:hypothetical protein n=1 Tax=Streptomyces sp. H34-S4 TaxID=2996463 RepID=UPI00226E8BA3|nr:hypothetical protein [Streptomyces sp. H34-S4]MCY0937202.1 hypothetical protein [Streptomyces sp. H34-S4]
MQLRRVLPLSLVALLASAGCVSSGGPRVPDVPARGSVPPADAPELDHPQDAASAVTSPAPDPLALPAEPPLPLVELPARPGTDRTGTARTDTGRSDAGYDADGSDAGREPARRAAKAPRPGAERRAKPAAPRRAHPPEKASARPARPVRPARNPGPPAPRTDELCAAAEGSVPPSIVDLCIRQSTR